MKFITSLALLLIASVGMAQGLPNTFTAGTPALAAEVNENFTNLDTRTSTNTSDVATNASNIAQSLGGIVLEQWILSDGSGVAAELCPVNTIVGSAQCDCDYENGTRNFGVLFGCQVAGNGGVAGCFPEGTTYNPGLPMPLATITLVCVSGVQNDGTPIVPIFSKAGPPVNAKVDVDGTEFEVAVNKARTAVADRTNALQAR